MITLDNLFTFFEFIAEENTYIQHQPGTSGTTNRFSRFATESTAGQLSKLGFPRLEVVQLPFGFFTDYGSSQHDTATVRVRVIYKLTDKFDFAEETTKLDNSKAALVQMLDYILQAQEEGSNSLLCAFDLNTVRYTFLDKATFSGSAVGCELSINFKECVNWQSVTYGDFPEYNGTIALPLSNGDYILNVNNGTYAWQINTGGGQSYTFENGLTETTGTVVLGGDILQNTYVTYDTVNTGNPMGLFYLLDGIVQTGTPPNQAIFFGELPDFANMSTRNGYTVINSDNGAQGCIIGNEKAVIEVVKQPEGYGAIELEVYSPDDTIVSALKITPDYLTFGDYFNASNLYLSLDGDLDLYQLGKINGGTFYEADNGNSNHNFYAPTGITNQIDDTGAFYFGDSITDGSWRLSVAGGDMNIEKLVSGSWVTKQTWA